MLSQFVPLPLMARLSGRSWWALRYYGGRVIEEPVCDWLDAPHEGRQALRLYCPNGEMAELGAEGSDGTGRFFQFKQAILSTSMGRKTLAHVVGLVTDTEGRCLCAAWEYETARLVRFEDNAYAMRYGNVGQLCADHLGLDTK